MASVALSFFYVAFVRILQLLRLRRDDRDELAIEVIMLRHEVSVLRRQRVRSALEPANRAPLAGLSRLLSKSRRERFFVRPETLLRWHRDLVRRRWTYKRSRMGPLAAPSWLSRGMTMFSLVSNGVLADQLYYLTQRVGAYSSSPNRS